MIESVKISGLLETSKDEADDKSILIADGEDDKHLSQIRMEIGDTIFWFSLQDFLNAIESLKPNKT